MPKKKILLTVVLTAAIAGCEEDERLMRLARLNISLAITSSLQQSNGNGNKAHNRHLAPGADHGLPGSGPRG